MKDEGNTLSRIGAALFVIWGVVHIGVGGAALGSLFTSGPAAMFAQAELIVGPNQMDATMNHVANLIAEYYFDIVALGILAIIVSVCLIWQNRPLGFWINVIVLGIADLAFLFAEIVPGYQPLFPPLLGPIIYVLASVFSGAALLKKEEQQAATAATV